MFAVFGTRLRERVYKANMELPIRSSENLGKCFGWKKKGLTAIKTFLVL